MRILLDTQALILAGQDHLPAGAARAYASERNTVYFSVASLWEIGIKAAIQKLIFDRRLTEYHEVLVQQGLLPLSIEPSHIERAVGLPRLHKDPFDHLLIGQALEESLTVMTGDEIFERYGCARVW